MATSNYKRRTHDQNETNKVVRYHQEEKTVQVYGHVCRLDEPTPAQAALKYIRTNNNMKKLRGGQKISLEKYLNKIKTVYYRPLGILVCVPIGHIVLFICATVFGHTLVRSQPLKFVTQVG